METVMAGGVNINHPIQHPNRFFIDGEWATPSSDDMIHVRDSANEEIFLSVAEAQVADVDQAVAAARHAFDRGPWPRLSHRERAEWMNKVADGWERRVDDIADTWTRESGILRSYAGVLANSAETFRYYASLAEGFQWEEPTTSETGQPALRVREPVGVVGAIVPWNAPSSLMAYKVAPALIAGCTVVVKASPEAPASAYILAEICEKVGLPKGVINILTADREVSERLVRHPDVDKITFTGSTAAGRRIASICGERIARVTLELGGKSPAVILDDYDVGLAAEQISSYAGLLTGQVCSSLTRLIIPRKRHDQFVEALAAAVSKIKVGDPFHSETQMGPLAVERQRDRVEDYIAKGRAEGAQLAAGGRRPSNLNRGYYVEPTVFANVDNSWTIAREEIFGPVLSVIPADSEAQAIEIANDTVYGLNSTVFTNDPDRAYTVGRLIRAGTVGHNEFKTDFKVGFGGFKQSGIGREGGVDGLMPFLEAKSMIFETMPSHVE
jgi:acyl-CoA reductase-like NAD-dependent aldehyde dehydrogenase